MNRTLRSLETSRTFADRHIGPDADEQAKMLAVVGYGSLDDLAAQAMPAVDQPTNPGENRSIPPAATEVEVTDELRALAAQNSVLTPMIGLGYYATHTPAVIRRNVLENPAWYTAYTPYQPEISQGRLEALLNFQTVISDLTGLPVAGASLLDEPTAAAEAMALCRRNSSSSSHRFYVDADVLPQTIAVIRTRAIPMGLDVVVVDLAGGLPGDGCFGVLVQDPGTTGRVRDHAALAEQAHAAGALVVAATDLLALTLLRPPGEWGADIAVGSSQRFGVPLWFGGPHAGFIAVRESLARSLPGRLVGQSIDADGQPAYRLALQTREQHIRREKATSNICTAQVLLAVTAAMYAVYHGPDGLTNIAARVHRNAAVLAAGLRRGGIDVAYDAGEFFDTVQLNVPGRAAAIVTAARDRGINVRLIDAATVSISCDETTQRQHIAALWSACGLDLTADDIDAVDETVHDEYTDPLRRTSDFLRHPVFHEHRSETSMLRYLRRLSDKDVALDRSMIPLGSCTMKLNATTEMEPISWPEFAQTASVRADRASAGLPHADPAT